MKQLLKYFAFAVGCGVLSCGAFTWALYSRAKPALMLGEVNERRHFSVEERWDILHDVEALGNLAAVTGFRRLEALTRGSAALMLMNLDGSQPSLSKADRYLKRTLRLTASNPDAHLQAHHAYSMLVCKRDGREAAILYLDSVRSRAQARHWESYWLRNYDNILRALRERPEYPCS